MIEHEHADIDGIRMHYAVAGRGDGPPVLLLHGFPEGWFVWRLLMEDLAKWISRLKEPGALTAGLDWYRAARLGPPGGQGDPGGSNLVEGLDPAALHVDTPVLVIRADQDMYLLPSGLDGLHRYCTDVRIRRIADADHWVSLEKPALVARYLREHFGGRGEAAARSRVE